MNSKKSYIPIKILISYLILAALFVGVGWFLYSESNFFSKTESKIAKENSKILKVSNLLSNVYKTESLARIAIQSNSEKDFKNYVAKTDTLKSDIDSLKLLVTTPYQSTLLDSVKFLLSKKTQNIKQLKAIKNKTDDEASVKNAITDLTKMEASLRKLQLEDFVKYPSAMGTYQRNVLKKYVAYLNQNIPDDSTNTLTKKASDSILLASKALLNQVKEETAKKKESLNFEENKLLQNELSISEQLRKVLSIVESEIIKNTTKNYFDRENSLKKTNQIVTIAAAVGSLSTLFFLILILNDFSKTQSYKKQLEIANTRTKSLLKNREQLISTVSHDLKTPLSTILGYTELLDNSDLNKKQLYFTKNIKTSSEYISKLVQDLLDFTQIEAGKIAIEHIPFSLNDIISDVAKSIQSIYEPKSIALLIETDEKLNNPIMGDPFRLRQILTNLIGNAYKFTEKGFIKIETKIDIENHKIKIMVEDSGIGIAEKKQQLIFEEFTQANGNIEKKYGGTGLGLTISKSMVEILGGKLSLKSVLGKGSIFEIELPLQFNTSLPQKTSITNNPKDELTAIIIDDDINLLKLTAEILKQNNYNVIPFNNAADALEAIRTSYFDFIITDIQMPEIDGFLFLEKLKNATASKYKNQPIIAVTGRTDLDLEVYKKAGFMAVVKKPYAPNKLLIALNAIFNPNNNQATSDQLFEESDLNKPYSLLSLQSFFTDDDEALKEFLTSFIKSTKENLIQLENAVVDNNILKIKEISHRICPMFKQIQANTITEILDDLELKDLSIAVINANFKELKNKIATLFILLEKAIN
ncbi:hybrid sensor histidine kinase/response regulator [Flavobacterium sp. LT1R49]|uniref:hybrid sensor histidine kinase/response regulator n=1 Tax=Flavobacterium arabinosi TaxID=3398737 RepID=UPI003A87583E